MKNGVFFYHINAAILKGEANTVTEALTPLKKYGIDFVEVDSDQIVERYNTKELVKELNDNGVRVDSSFYAFVFDPENKNAVEDAKEETLRRLELAQNLGSRIYLAVPRVIVEHKNEEARCECRKMVAEYMTFVSEQAGNFGLVPTFENISALTMPYSRIDDIEYMLENVPGIKYVFDTGNFWFGGTDVLEALDKFNGKFVHVHAKDTCPGKSCDIAIGTGVLPLEEVFNKIIAKGYDGTVSLEPGGNIDKHIQTLAESYEYLKKFGI